MTRKEFIPIINQLNSPTSNLLVELQNIAEEWKKDCDLINETINSFNLQGCYTTSEAKKLLSACNIKVRTVFHKRGPYQTIVTIE